MSITPQKAEKLDEVLSTLERMKKACSEMKDGKTEYSACKDNNLDSELFGILLRKNWTYKKGDNSAKLKSSRDYWFDWREFFCYAVYKDAVKPLDDFDEAFDLVVNMLSDYEKEVIINYFKNEKSFQTISYELGITLQAVRNRYNMAMKKLVGTDLRKYFEFGVALTKLEEDNQTLLDKKKSLTDKLITLRKMNIELSEEVSILETTLGKVGVEPMLYHLEDVKGLSQRTYNILRRNGVQYLDEISYHERDWFLRLSGFGKVAYDELVNVAHVYGLKEKGD